MTDPATTSGAGSAPPEVNWFEEEGPGAATDKIKTPEEVSVEGYRETTRGRLASWLMALLSLTVLVILTLATLEVVDVIKKPEFSLEGVSQLVLTPVVTLTASALGFYFGAHTANPNATGKLPPARDPGLIRWIWRKLW